MGMDLLVIDNRSSTPLHWACYSKSEIALQYLLAWLDRKALDMKDVEGYTPLHLAVKSVDTLRSSRPVRSLLIKGADRNVVDNNNKKPIDLAQQISIEHMKREVTKILQEPSVFNCLMLTTPMKLVRKSFGATALFLFLIFFSLLLQLFFLYPCKEFSLNFLGIDS